MNKKYLGKAAGVFFLALWFSCFVSKAQDIIPPPFPYFLLDSWSFNDTNWYSDFGDAPVSFTNLNNPPSFDGNALQVDSTNPAFLQYNIVDEVATNLTFDQGTIELWVLPDWNSGAGPGDWGRLIDVGAYSTNSPSSWWSLYFSPDGTSINFSSETNGVFTNYLSYPISWDTNTWHLVDLTFFPSRTRLYIDGQRATNGGGMNYVPSPEVASNGFFVGSDVTGWQQSRSLIDDLATYNYELSEDDVSNDYAAMMGVTGGGGFGPDDDGPVPPGSGTNESGSPIFYPPDSPDYGTNLYLQLTNAINNQVSGWINNSSIYVPYTIFSRPSLLWPIWSPEATFYGSWSTNVTAFSVSMLARSNLFLEARSEIAPRIVGAGNSDFAALRRDGTVWEWGSGGDGQLGNGQWSDSATPVQALGLSNVVAVAEPSAGDFTLALDACGKVWSWGENGNGQLGRDDGLYTNEDTPAIIPGLSNIVAIAGGGGHGIALRSDDTVWAWGDNAYGDLGNGTNTQRDYAAPVPGLTNAIAIVSGDDHCFALCANGTVWGWGYNEDWELGIGNADDQFAPVLVTGLTNAIALSGGSWFSVALLSNGTIEAWGANYIGEIGDISSSTPVPVPGLSNIVSIASGAFHSLFLETNGNIYAWGADFYGQFGDNATNYGSTVPYLIPISHVTAIAGGFGSTVVSTGNGNIYTFGQSYEYEPAPTLTDLYINYSSDGSGLPDWWEMMYFGHLGLNPGSDPVGDGLTLLEDYEENLDPTNFLEPAAVTGLTVRQTNALGNIILTWNAETPTPLDYEIFRIDYNYTNYQYGTTQEIGEVAGNVTTFTDNGSVPGGDDNSIYEVDGIYGGGTAPFSAEAYVNSQPPSTLTDNLPFTVQLVRNGTGRWQIMFSGLPSGLQTIQLSWQAGSSSTTQNISVSNLINGVYSISDSDVVNDLGTTLYAQGIGPDGLPGQQIYAGALPNDAPYFVDGQEHIEQNLNFLIRGANTIQPFAGSYEDYGDSENDDMNKTNTTFEEFSYLHHAWAGPLYDDIGPYYTLDNLWPFECNYYFADFLPDTSREYVFAGDTPFETNTFNFQPDFSTNVPAPPILARPDPYWIYQDGFAGSAYDPNTTNWGVTFNFDNPVNPSATLQSSINNIFGLPCEAGCVISLQHTNIFYQVLSAGDTITAESNSTTFYQYASFYPAPTLQFTNYYLAPLNNPTADTFGLPANQPCPLPIQDSFNVTNETPAVMFGSVGQPMILGVWAKYSIEGSSPTKYAYLGQYFTTNAWEVNSIGDITATNTGIVSPYGEFFPTEPGPVALITMTNADSGTQATGIVNVISLAVDANHDGTIDPTWNGQDMTSPSSPYVFWANNNYDRWDYDFLSGTNEQDDVLSGDDSAPEENQDPDDPDCNYTVDGQREIPDTRDLEDFGRLWVCGLTSNLLAELPAGSTVTLSWGDVGNPNPNNPTIDLFAAADTNGGMGYLTNETIATEQVNTAQCPYIGRIGPGQSIQINTNTFANNWAGNYFIWCGVSNGTGGLTLTITDPNSNVLAQTTAYIQIEDIKQMYERWTVGDNPSVAPLTTAQLATNDLPAGVSEPFRYVNPPAPGTPYILHVHGYNMPTWEKDRYAETEFKRLYWQGYQGRFGDFHWPTATYALGFGGSEIQAWLSAQGLLNKLNDLNSQYPGQVYLTVHSLGNVVAGEALRLAQSNQVVNTYVAMQGAVSSHAYDPTTPYWSPTPDAGEPDCYANYSNFDSPCYFNASMGAGAYVNFYNTNDWALRVAWLTFQDAKPLGALGYGFSPPSVYTYLDVDRLYFPGDTYTIFSYILQSQSYALGMQPGVQGVFKGKQADAPSFWPADPSGDDYGDHLWHSAEFRSDAPQRWLFWNAVLDNFGIPK